MGLASLELRTRIGLDVGAGAMAKPDDVTGHAAHFGGYLAGWAVGKGTPFLFVEDDTSTEKKHGI